MGRPKREEDSFCFTKVYQTKFFAVTTSGREKVRKQIAVGPVLLVAVKLWGQA